MPQALTSPHRGKDGKTQAYNEFRAFLNLNRDVATAGLMSVMPRTAAQKRTSPEGKSAPS
jgi:hypothetical protein